MENGKKSNFITKKNNGNNVMNVSDQNVCMEKSEVHRPSISKFS